MNNLFGFFWVCLVLIFLCRCDKEPYENDTTSNLEKVMNHGFALIDSGHLDSALITFKQTKAMPGRTQNKAMCSNAIGNIYFHKYNYPKALEGYLNAIHSFEQIEDSVNVSNASINAGLCFKNLGMYSKAAEYVGAALKLFEQDSVYEKQRIVGYNLLGNIYKDLKNYELSESYHNKALGLLTKQPEMSLEPTINDLGNTYFAMGDTIKARNQYHRYLEMALENRDSSRIGRGYQNLAKTYIGSRGLREVCRSYLDSAYKYYSILDYKPGLALLHRIEGEFYLGFDDHQATEHGEKSYSLNQKLGDLQEELRSLSLLRKGYRLLGEYEKATEISENFIRLSDSINNKEKIGQIYTYEMLGRVAKKDEQIKQERQRHIYEKRIRFALVALALALCVIAVLFIIRYLNKERFVKEYFSSESSVILKSGSKVEFDEILRVETLRNDLIIIKTNYDRLIEKNTTLKSFVPSLPKIQFGRPQRGIIVNFKMITKVWKTKLDLLEESINISKKYSDEFMDGWHKFQEVWSDSSSNT